MVVASLAAWVSLRRSPGVNLKGLKTLHLKEKGRELLPEDWVSQ